MYRIRFLDYAGASRHAYIGESKDVDNRIGNDHLNAPEQSRMCKFINGTLHHGGSIEVDLLSTSQLVTPGGPREARMERELARLGFEGLAAVKEMDLDGLELLNAEDPIPNDDVPADVRDVKGWWEVN